jgi:hypothetical protein
MSLPAAHLAPTPMKPIFARLAAATLLSIADKMPGSTAVVKVVGAK